MKTSRLGRYALSSCVAAVMLAGCGGAQVATPPADAASASRVRSHTSSGDLVYATRETGTVVVATYPSLKTVTKFNLPSLGSSSPLTFGICSDTSGNVFVTANFFTPYAGNIYEYSHGATSPFTTLSVATYYQAYDCAYDPATGNLAIADYCNGCGTGSVSIFANEQGQPAVYTDPKMGLPLYVGYDSSGNLFASGENTRTGASVFAELPKGSSTFTDPP
jgi:hypothetical protein